MPAKVADTSVLAALIYGEPQSQQAEVLPAEAELFEPPLLSYELATVCRKKIAQYPNLTSKFLQALIGLSIDIQWVNVDHRAVVELSFERNLTTYDATFLWVSVTLEIPLLTFDKQLQASTTN